MAERKFLEQAVPPKQPGAPIERAGTSTASAIIDSFMLDTHLGQWMQRDDINGLLMQSDTLPDPKYNPWRDPALDMNNIAPHLLDEITKAESTADAQAILAMSQLNLEREKRLEGHGLTRFLTGLADPYNLIPVPLALGRGFVAGFKRTLLPNAGIVTAAEVGRTQYDPNDTIGQVALNISMGTLLASSLGGAFGMIPHAPGTVGKRFDAYAAQTEILDTQPGPKLTDLAMDDARVARLKDHLPDGVTAKDIIRGTADDGLPFGDGIIKFQAMRRGDEAFGARYIIKRDPKGGDMVLLKNNEIILRGTKRELVAAAEDLGTERVANFADRAALDRGETRFEEAYPDAPDRATDPVGYDRFVAEQRGKAPPRDDDGVILPKADGLSRRHLMRDAMDAERLELSDKLTDQQAEIDRLKAEKVTWEKRYKHPNQHYKRDVSEAQLLRLDNRIGKLEAAQATVRSSLNDVEQRIEIAEGSDDPADYMLKSTGIGLEKLYGRSGIFPWFRVVNTKLAKLAPDLAVEWQKIPYRLAGSPGLMYKGGEKGVGVGTSAEMQAVQWWHTFREAKMATDKEYAQLYGYGESIGPTQQAIMETKEEAVNLLRRAKLMKRGDQDADRMGSALSFPEFRGEISKAMINGGKVTEQQRRALDSDTVAAIEASASHWRTFFDKFKADAERLGVFQTQRSVNRRIEKVQARIDEADSHLLPFEDPFMDIQVEVREGTIPEELRKAKPGEERKRPAATRTTIEGEDVIYIDRGRVAEMFKAQAWRRPKMEGVEPLDFDFENPDEWVRFVLAHEKAHVRWRQRDGEGNAEYENRINRHALEEIQRMREVRPTGLQRAMQTSWIRRRKRLELELDALEQQRDAMRGMSEEGDWLAPDYFHRMWSVDNIKANEAEFKNILYTHFKENPYIWRYGRRIHASENEAAIRLRVDEAYDNIIREGEMADPLMVRDDAMQRASVKSRIEELEADIATMKRGSPEWRKAKRRVEIYREALAKPEEWIRGGLPTPLRSRALDIHNRELVRNETTPYIELDVEHVAQVYLQKMAPLIEVTRNFGDHRLADYRASLNNALEERIVQAQVEGNSTLATQLKAEMDQLNNSVDDLRDMVLGHYGMSKNPANWTGRTVRLSMAWMNLVGMGRAVLVALNDFGNYVGYVGFKRAMGDAWRYSLARARNDRSEWNIARDEALAAGEASNIWSAQRAIALTDIGGMRGFGKFEAGVQRHQRRFFIFNLLTPWTDFMEGMTGAMAQHAIIRDAVAMTAGKLSKSRLAEVTKLGMTKRMAKQISDEWHAIPEKDRQGRHIFLANSHLWKDPETQRAFRAMLSTEIANLVPAPKAADKPTFMHKDWGRLMFQYKGFSFAATSRIMMANLQRRDARAMSTVTAMIGMSYLIDLLKQPDFMDRDLDDQLFRAVEISGVAGIFSDANQVIEGASGYEAGLRPALGLDEFERDVSIQTQFGAVAGPVPNLVTSFGAAFLSDDAETADRARAIRYMIPYNNLLYWSWIVNRMQRSAVSALE